MKKNIILRENTSLDINKQVEKVLRGLGNPEPPIKLESVLELLKLDKKYYSSSNDSYIQESVSRILVAGKQIIKRPSLLVDAIKKFELRALYIPDEKRILLDEDMPPLKHRWAEAHEVGHDIIPWHGDLMHGDTKHTISPATHEQIEAEANYAAGQMLFLSEKFVEVSNDYEANLTNIRKIKGIFGNTLTTTLWRYIESANLGTPMVGLVSDIPYKIRENNGTLSEDCYFIRSASFDEQFNTIESKDVLEFILDYCGNQKGGPLGKNDVVLTDINKKDHIFHFETFSNTYQSLTLGVYKKEKNLIMCGSL